MAKKKTTKKTAHPLRRMVYFALDNGLDGDDLFEGMEEARRTATHAYENVIDEEIFGSKLESDVKQRVGRVADDMWDDHVQVNYNAYIRGLQGLAEQIKRDPDIVNDETAMWDIAVSATKRHQTREEHIVALAGAGAVERLRQRRKTPSARRNNPGLPTTPGLARSSQAGGGVGLDTIPPVQVENPAKNPMPKAYDPQEGYRYQILCRNQEYDRAWEHCDYAVDRADKKHLLENYRMAYGAGWEFKTIMLPQTYWPKETAARAPNPGPTTTGALIGRLKF
jgi:hypothetical protein